MFWFLVNFPFEIETKPAEIIKREDKKRRQQEKYKGKVKKDHGEHEGFKANRSDQNLLIKAPI